MRLGCGVDRACDACACAPSLLLRCSRLDAETFLSHTHLPSSLSCLRVEFSVVWGEGRCRASDSPSLCTLSLSDSLTLTWIWQIVYGSDKLVLGILFTESFGGQNRLFLAKRGSSRHGEQAIFRQSLVSSNLPKAPQKSC